MVRPITAYAVVSKKNPRINVMDIYSKEQVKDIYINKDSKGNTLEVIVPVTISLRDKPMSVFDIPR